MLDTPLPAQAVLNRGRYVVQRHIGRGGFGYVYLAADAQGRRYAIKEAFDRQRVARGPDGYLVVPLAAPAQAAREHAHQCKRAHEEFALFQNPALQHDALVRLLDCFDQNSTTYLVMPYIDGVTLHELARDPRRADAPWVLGLLHQIAEVLDMLHRNGMIHRDLKPENVLVARDGQSGSRPVVLDTGATRPFKVRDTVHTGIVTDFGPPEIVGLAEARIYGLPGPQSDCFALAGMAYLLLVGQKPPDWTQRAFALDRTGGTDPLVRPVALSSDVWAVLCRSLALTVQRRHAGAGHLLTELRRALALPRTAERNHVRAEAGNPVEGRAALPKPHQGPAMLRWNRLPYAPTAWISVIAALGALGLTGWLLLGSYATALIGLMALCLHLGVALLVLQRGGSWATALFPFLNGLTLWRLRNPLTT